MVVGVGGALPEGDGRVIVGLPNGTSSDVAVLLKNPVLRKLSVSWRPNSAPASNVWRTAPVDSAYDHVRLVEDVRAAASRCCRRSARPGCRSARDRARHEVLIEAIVAADERAVADRHAAEPDARPQPTPRLTVGVDVAVVGIAVEVESVHVDRPALGMT